MSKDAIEPEGGGVASKTAIYNKIASKQGVILTTLFDLLKSNQETVRIGAARTLINKIIPDLKSTEHSGEIGLYKIHIDATLELDGGDTKTLHATLEPKANTPLKGKIQDGSGGKKVR